MIIRALLLQCPITGLDAVMNVYRGCLGIERWISIHSVHQARDGRPRMSLFLVANTPEELRPLCEQLARTWNEYLRPQHFVCESDTDYNEPYK